MVRVTFLSPRGLIGVCPFGQRQVVGEDLGGHDGRNRRQPLGQARGQLDEMIGRAVGPVGDCDRPLPPLR